MRDYQESDSIPGEFSFSTGSLAECEDSGNETAVVSERLASLSYLGLSKSTETIDFNQLFTPEVTESGSFDFTGAIWTTTFGKLLQALPIMAFLVDASSKIVAANRMCEKLGPDYQRAVGVRFAGLLPNAAEAEQAERDLREVFSTRKQRAFQGLIRIAKVNVWGRMTFRSIRVGPQRMVMVLIEDLTAETEKFRLQQELNTALRNEINGRKRAEQELAASEKRYRQMVETANDLIYMTNEQGRFTYLNPLALHKSGFSQEELLGQRYLRVVHPDHRNAVDQYYLSQFATRTLQTYYELPILAKSGETVWIGQNVQLLVENDKILGFQAIARDITDRKMAEEKLTSSLKEKEVLVREIHHRVKNNFQVISGLLTLQADHAQDKKSAEVLSDANARVRAMALVHEKLYQSPNLAQIKIDEYVGDLVRDLLGFGHENTRGITTEIDVEKLDFDPDKAIPIGLIISELLTNAMKHAFPDGREGAVHVRLHRTDKDHLELSVGDNGIRIPPGIHPENTRSLGLALVAAFVRKLRAEISLDTSGGTKFSIKFKSLSP
jgi:PAS domain S-box-containing protein